MKRRHSSNVHSLTRKGALLMGVACVAMLGGVPVSAAEARSQEMAHQQYEFSPPVFDIEAAPDGSILVAEGATIKEIRRGAVQEVAQVPTVLDSPITGLAATGRGNFFAVSGRLTFQEEQGSLWRVSRGGPRLVADLDEIETEQDPDAIAGPQWADQRCNAEAGFTAGPQSNPYHATPLTGSEVLIADAAANTLLRAKTNGAVDWVAVFTPPVDDDGDWLVRFTLDSGTSCYVNPVPTSVAVGQDGAYYVGELTGATADPAAAPGLSRVWRIEPDARNVVCPSDACEIAIDGLTSVIDVAFGPDGRLYVVEYDANGWLAALTGNPAGGTIKSCSADTGTCTTVEDDLSLPGAITFDTSGELWVVEDNITTPTVRQIDKS